MVRGLSRRIDKLEQIATEIERAATRGSSLYYELIERLERGEVTLYDLSDAELETIVRGGPGDVDLRDLSDEELERIARGEG